MYFLGIDGGGTKTDFLVTDDRGNVIAQKRIGTVSYRIIGADSSIRLLNRTIAELLEDLEGPTFICMAYPNWGESEAGDSVIWNRRREISIHPIRIVNDCVAGWAGSLAMEPGINLVAGTGSIAYGRNASGREARAGGWSEHFSDEGSCYWLGMKTLELFAKESDGRAEDGVLLEIIREYFRLKDDFELIDIYDNEYCNNRTRTAGLQRLLLQAAQAGDKEARKIYVQAADELALIVEAVYRKLGFGESDGNTAVSCSGGLFHAGELVMNPLEHRLGQYGIRITKPRFTPVQGAVLLAADEYGGYPAVAQVMLGKMK